ncbi:MAG TPA: FtsX-like permease family protein, partial [Casimicrobiaceae bacterium]
MSSKAARYAVAHAALGGAFARERGRLALAALAIALGVALGFAVDLVNRTAVAEFTSGMATLSGNADLEVRGPRAGFDESVYPMLARVGNVAVASPIVEVQVRVPNFDEPLTLFGVDAFRAARVTPALVGAAKDSIDLLDPRVVFMSAAALARYGAHVGGTLTLRTGAADSVLRVAGVAGDNGRERYAIMDIGALQDLFARAGMLTRIDLRLVPGSDPAIAMREIGARLPAGVVVATPTAAIDAASRASRAYRVNMDVLALVALLTGALLVFSTQVLAVARRRSQFALLRTLGLTRRGLVLLVIGEGATIGATGAVIGLPLGYALARVALDYFGGDLGA